MKKFRLLLILTICLLSSQAFGQPVETIYQGTLVYQPTVPPSIMNNLPLAEDGPFPIGFNFSFFGVTYTEFYVSENGRIMFTDPTSPSSTEVAIPNAAVPNNFIAAFWDNLNVDYTGNILYATIGTAPNRKLVVQFKNLNIHGESAYFGTFAIIIYETTNIIQTQHRLIVNNSSATAHGASATIGIENADGSAGVQYAYHSSTAVETGKVITYTPDGGGSYTIDTSSPYNFIYLTTNQAAPEPGIPVFLTPPQDAAIGSDYTFSWSNAGNVTAYQLYISEYSELAAATIYPAGTNLSYNVTGLALGKTLYWGVFASNSTGTTWCEVKRFTTSAAPPLAAVPQTMWVEQNQDKTITLAYTGGDASAKTAKITSLPVQGKLYQYNAGVKGAEITAPLPVTVTDATRNVIYSASGNSGNGAGNFNYLMNDAGGDSPAALITINVSPPGIPNVLYIAKSPTYVEIQFDIPMADPTGKEGQFTVTANGSPVALTSATFKPGDNNTYLLNTSAALTEPVLVSYTPGTVTAATGGVLLAFPNQLVALTAQTITWTQPLDLKYNQSPFALSATATSGTGVTFTSSNLSVATINVSTLTLLALGSTEITARKVGDATYAPVQYTRTLTASKGDQVITFTLPSKVYGAADFTLSATTTSGLPITYSSDNTNVATVTGNLVHIVSAGPAVITASQAGNTLWNSATNPQTLTVSKATLIVTADPKTRAYNAANPALTFAYSGWVLGAETIDTPPTASTTVTISSPPSVYAGAITVAGGLDNNYLFSFMPADFTVIKADQTITFTVTSKTYGDADFNLTGTSNSGLPVSYVSGNVNAATVTGGLVHIAGAGSSVITATQAGDANYNAATPVLQTLDINQATLTVTADPKTKEEGTANPPLTFTYSGWVAGIETIDTPPTATTTVTLSSPAGVYPDAISVSGGLDNNYLFSFVPADFTVTPPPVGIESVPEAINFKMWYGNESIYLNCPNDLTASTGRLVVYDMQGKVVADNSDISLVPGETIRTSIRLPKGIYAAKLKAGTKEYVARVAVM